MKKIMIMLMNFLLVCGSVMTVGSTKADAQAKTVAWKGYTLATYDDAGRMVFHSTGTAYMDSRGLEYLLMNDKKKTLIIPSGTTVEVDQVVDIGNNTTIIADGAQIVQQKNGLGVLKHMVDKNNYNALKNVTIQGGVWKNKVNTKGCTTFRFVHASNLRFQNATIQTNYRGHGLELIACKNVVVDKCQILAENNATKGKNIREEALQIDLATPLTAPGVLEESGKKSFVNGQTCKNITISNCTVRGSRGICASFAAREKKFINKMHTNITIKNCNVTGTNAEAISLFNAVGCKVENNTARTNCSLKKQPYSDAIHFILMGKNKQFTKYKNNIVNNTAYGNYFGIEVTSKLRAMYGSMTVTNNKIYSKQGKSHCLSIKFCKKAKVKANTKHAWK